MTERVEKRLELLLSKEYRKSRICSKSNYTELLNAEKSPSMRAAKLFALTLAEEKPLFHGEDDAFGFNRYCESLCEDQSSYGSEWQFGNVIIDYERYLKGGLNGIRAQILECMPGKDEEAGEFYRSALVTYDACFDVISRYRECAKNYNPKLYEALRRVPENGATNYYEALIMIRFIHYAMRLARNCHLTLGRFDQYMKPYYDASVKAGASKDELIELTELFFIAINLDTDVYKGVQQGDNGQSMVLGGCDKAGNDAYNELSEICLFASEELKVIDPKINVRVNKNTPLSFYERCTRLTKQGLGFPQYCNDDVVIPALLDWGYDLEDARNYGVAACWEIISSGNGADIPNVSALNFPLMVERAVKAHLVEAKDFGQLMDRVEDEIKLECENIVADKNATYDPFADLTDANSGFMGVGSVSQTFVPFISTLITPCIENGRDANRGGAKYNNFGAHGAGLSTATDALCAIKKAVFDDKTVSASTVLNALEANFEGYSDLRKYLKEECPKMGNNDDYADDIAVRLTACYAKNFRGKKNSRGGIYRAGTGSAMEYIRMGAMVGATADGRLAGDVFSCSYSPAIDAKTNGPLSVIQSFTKPNLKEVCNGGPFTIEVHDTVFRNAEGERKVAMLVKTFIDLGGHQMQINALNREVLLDAQKNPDKYPRLIVRVWGWSGYFNELETAYQNHVIRRTQFTV